MSKTGSLNLMINSNSRNINIIDLLDLFCSYGWGVNDNEFICYLPLGDENFDWMFSSISKKKEVYNVLLSKDKKSEIIGINLISEETNAGLNVLFYPNYERISLSAEINRKVIDSLDVTDFSWYLAEVIPVFLKAGFSIEVIECVDS